MPDGCCAGITPSGLQARGPFGLEAAPGPIDDTVVGPLGPVRFLEIRRDSATLLQVLAVWALRGLSAPSLAPAC